MKSNKPVFAAIITAAVFALIFWLAGYNFDERNSTVAWGAAVTILCMCFVAALVSDFTKECK